LHPLETNSAKQTVFCLLLHDAPCWAGFYNVESCSARTSLRPHRMGGSEKEHGPAVSQMLRRLAGGRIVFTPRHLWKRRGCHVVHRRLITASTLLSKPEPAQIVRAAGTTPFWGIDKEHLGDFDDAENGTGASTRRRLCEGDARRGRRSFRGLCPGTG
jgi:hypothetical protein